MAEKVEVIIKATDKATGVLKSIGLSFNSLGKSIGKGALGISAGLAAVGVGMYKLAEDAAPIEQIQASFSSLAEGMGTDMDKMLAELNKGAAGMVSNTDLMKSFNLAASLISEDFAKNLPNAMSSLTKASGATGESMSYLMDSLVRGVGRLSPMILDNLGIQVDLTQAYEDFAEANGLVATELTKTEQQAALMEQVMGKLGDKYGEMPDVADSAMASFAGFRATLSNVKDEIGLALLPALRPLAEKFTSMASDILPILTGWISDKLVPAVSELVSFFSDLISGSPEDVMGGLANVVWYLARAFGANEETALGLFEKIIALREPFNEIKDAILAFVNDVIIPFVQEHAEGLKGALAGIAIAFAIGAVISTVIGLLTALTSPIGLIIIAAGLLGMAWTENWGGIQEKTKAVWEWLQPKLQTLWDWLEVNIPAAIETLRVWWEETLLPALQNFWTWVTESLIPKFQEIWDWLSVNLTEAIDTVVSYWEETLLPALQNFWTWVTENLIPLFESITELFEVIWQTAITAAAGLWENILQPAIQKVADVIGDTLQPILDALKTWFDSDGKTALENFKTSVLDKMKGAWDNITSAIQSLIEKINAFKTKLQNIKLPWWLTPGSPTPFENGLVGIQKQMMTLANKGLPTLQAKLNIAAPNLGDATLASTGGGRLMGGSSLSNQTVNHFHLNVASNRESSNIIEDFHLLQSLAAG